MLGRVGFAREELDGFFEVASFTKGLDKVVVAGGGGGGKGEGLGRGASWVVAEMDWRVRLLDGLRGVKHPHEINFLQFLLVISWRLFCVLYRSNSSKHNSTGGKSLHA